MKVKHKKRKNGVIVDYCEQCAAWWVRDNKNYINFCPVCRIDLLPQKPLTYFINDAIWKPVRDLRK